MSKSIEQKKHVKCTQTRSIALYLCFGHCKQLIFPMISLFYRKNFTILVTNEDVQRKETGQNGYFYKSFCRFDFFREIGREEKKREDRVRSSGNV